MGKSYHANMAGHVTHLASRGKVSSLQNIRGKKMRNTFKAGGPTEFGLLPGSMNAPCRRPNLATVRLPPFKLLLGKLML